MKLQVQRIVSKCSNCGNKVERYIRKLNQSKVRCEECKRQDHIKYRATYRKRKKEIV